MKSDKYNPYLDLFKFIFAIMVVLIHNALPGKLGYGIDCVARVAVPFFFIISGYYSYESENHVLWRRAKRIIVLLIGLLLVSFIWGIWKTTYIQHDSLMAYFQSSINKRTIVRFFIYGLTPFPYANQIWFLVALIIAYIVLIIFNSVIKKEKPRTIVLRVLLIILIMGHFIVGSFPPIFTDIDIINYYYRNAWLFGIPVFLLGYFICFYNKRSNLVERCSIIFLIASIIGGLVLGMLQWFRFGRVEMPVGVLLATVFIFILALKLKDEKRNRSERFNRISRICGKVSLWIYAIHRLVGDAIQTYASYNRICRLIYENGYLYPMIVIIISVCVSLIIVVVSGFVKSGKHLTVV